MLIFVLMHTNVFFVFLVRNKYIATSVTISSYIIRRKIFENFIRLI